MRDTVYISTGPRSVSRLHHFENTLSDYRRLLLFNFVFVFDSAFAFVSVCLTMVSSYHTPDHIVSSPLISTYIVSCSPIPLICDDVHNLAGNPPVFMADGGFKDRLGAPIHSCLHHLVAARYLDFSSPLFSSQVLFRDVITCVLSCKCTFAFSLLHFTSQILYVFVIILLLCFYTHLRYILCTILFFLNSSFLSFLFFNLLFISRVSS